ncbi:hypothetical protein BaRGS_00007486, partial [Batillaria attramentaria]
MSEELLDCTLSPQALDGGGAGNNFLKRGTSLSLEDHRWSPGMITVQNVVMEKMKDKHIWWRTGEETRGHGSDYDMKGNKTGDTAGGLLPLKRPRSKTPGAGLGMHHRFSPSAFARLGDVKTAERKEDFVGDYFLETVEEKLLVRACDRVTTPVPCAWVSVMMVSDGPPDGTATAAFFIDPAHFLAALLREGSLPLVLRFHYGCGSAPESM